jgi:hypothetical protein
VPFNLSGVRAYEGATASDQLLLLFSEAGEVYRWSFEADGEALEETPELLFSVEDPEYTVLALASWPQLGVGNQVLVADRKGLSARTLSGGATASADAYDLTGLHRRLSPKFAYRVGTPRFADLCQDLNGDGTSELLLPLRDQMEVWTRTENTERPLVLTRATSLSMNAQRSERTRGTSLSDDFESVVILPRLLTRDVNGDGRLDILVRDGRYRAWHLQKNDGLFPAEPDVSVNLRIFEDTTPQGRIAPGQVLAGNNYQVMLSRDLDQDGRTDHVIAHGRKIWVLPGTEKGPQFTSPSQILKSSDDITTLLLADLDQDGRADLITLKLLIPSIGSLVASALGSLTIEVSAIAYAGTTGAKFESEAKWRNSLFIELPSLTTILKNPQAILQRFQEAGQTDSERIREDLDGDGALDILSMDGAAGHLQFWSGIKRLDREHAGDQLLKEILFDKDRTKWDLDKLVDLVERLADEDLRRDTQGRAPDHVTDLLSEDRWFIQAILTCKTKRSSGSSLLVFRLDPESRKSEVLHYRAAPKK